jgi:N-acetylglucosamine-6-sulfatase
VPSHLGADLSVRDASYENFTRMFSWLRRASGPTNIRCKARIRRKRIIRAVAGRTVNEFRTTGALLVALACLVVFSVGGCAGSEDANLEPTHQAGAPARPNIIFILTDDLDAAAARQLPKLRSLLVEEGVSFENSLASYPLCCPSRATTLTGLYAHNHGVSGNDPPNGGFQKFREKGLEDDTIAVRLQKEGYRTALFGKYLNHYGEDDPTHVPPGWDEWHAKVDRGVQEDMSNGGDATGGGTDYYDYELNENGEVVSYGDSPEDYLTDVISGEATGFVRRATAGSEPFFLYLAPSAPHDPATPAERHEGAFADEEAPRPASFGEEDVSDKPSWIRERRPISDRQASRKIDGLYRERLATMLAVDEMVDSLIGELASAGQLDNTFVFFTSDNGWHQGEHRIRTGKVYPYEESIRTPLFVRGPGVPARSTVEKLVVNTDFAPTIADLAGISFAGDGRSFMSLLRGEDPAWRSAVLLEAAGGGSPPSYSGVRTETYKYVEYQTGEKELYDLRSDPYETESLHQTAGSSLIQELKAKLSALSTCAGDGCREAEDTS